MRAGATRRPGAAGRAPQAYPQCGHVTSFQWGLLDSICILERSPNRTHWEGQIAGKRPVSHFLLRNEGTRTSGCGRGGRPQACELLDSRM